MPRSAAAARKAVEDMDFKELSPKQRIQRILDAMQTSTTRFHSPIERGGAKLLEASQPGRNQARTVWEFDNADYWGNSMGNLHGGAHATLFDVLTSLTIPIISSPDFWVFMGVTKTLNVTYLRPAPSDTPVIIECELVQIGKRSCVLRAVMKNKADGSIISMCEHHKANTDPKL